MPLSAPSGLALRVGRAVGAIDSSDPFLHFKTTHRVQYEHALAGRPDCDDVVLWNERGEATESTTANLVVRIDGALVTPPIDCGLLAGTFRAELLERGRIAERVVRVDDLANAEAVYLINSVRRCMTVVWVDEERSRPSDSGLGTGGGPRFPDGAAR
jgi:para-aminobenzoate synthetase/4-amino-4-deoxychorismate lyase